MSFTTSSNGSSTKSVHFAPSAPEVRTIPAGVSSWRDGASASYPLDYEITYADKLTEKALAAAMAQEERDAEQAAKAAKAFRRCDISMDTIYFPESDPFQDPKDAHTETDCDIKRRLAIRRLMEENLRKDDEEESMSLLCRPDTEFDQLSIHDQEDIIPTNVLRRRPSVTSVAIGRFRKVRDGAMKAVERVHGLNMARKGMDAQYRKV